MTEKPLTAEDVLATFSVHQPKTARMVADEFGIEKAVAERLLNELAGRGAVTKARGGTSVPVWVRLYAPERHPRRVRPSV